MDPTACLRRILEAYDDQDFGEMADACEDLQGWLWKGGFAPVLDAHLASKLTRILAEVAATAGSMGNPENPEGQ